LGIGSVNFALSPAAGRRIFDENSIGARLDQFANRSSIADHNELAATFQQMKTACFDLLDKPAAANFMFNPSDRAPDNSTSGNGFGGKDLINPFSGMVWGFD